MSAIDNETYIKIKDEYIRFNKVMENLDKYIVDLPYTPLVDKVLNAVCIWNTIKDLEDESLED